MRWSNAKREYRCQPLPILRQTAATDMPGSASFNAQATRSSVNLLVFTASLVLTKASRRNSRFPNGTVTQTRGTCKCPTLHILETVRTPKRSTRAGTNSGGKLGGSANETNSNVVDIPGLQERGIEVRLAGHQRCAMTARHAASQTASRPTRPVAGRPRRCAQHPDGRDSPAR